MGRDMTEPDDMRDFYASSVRYHARAVLDNDVGCDGQFGLTTEDRGAWKKVAGKWLRIGVYDQIISD